MNQIIKRLDDQGQSAKHMSGIDRYDKFKLMTGLTVSLVAFVFFWEGRAKDVDGNCWTWSG